MLLSKEFNQLLNEGSGLRALFSLLMRLCDSWRLSVLDISKITHFLKLSGIEPITSPHSKSLKSPILDHIYNPRCIELGPYD